MIGDFFKSMFYVICFIWIIISRISAQELSDNTVTDNEFISSENQNEEFYSESDKIQQEDKTTPVFNVISPVVSISGFGDMYTQIGKNEENENRMQVGQVEIDLETKIGGKVGIAAAIAYAPYEETFGLGQFTVNIPLFGEENEHFFVSPDINQSGIIAGLFDVPFGLDWNVYPSIDRKLISVPVVVEYTHNCWNDYGVQLYTSNDWFNGVLFSTNGFGYEIQNESGTALTIDTKLALGGRLGFKPADIIELGTSHAQMFDQRNRKNMYLSGADLQFNYNNLYLKGEYIFHSADLLLYKSNGFYLQGMYDFNNFFLVTRYDRFSTDSFEQIEYSQGSLGAGWIIINGCEMRYEYQKSFLNGENTNYLQLVVGF
jgi:hypothetical protein